MEYETKNVITLLKKRGVDLNKTADLGSNARLLCATRDLVRKVWGVQMSVKGLISKTVEWVR